MDKGVLHSLNYGMYVVSSLKEGKFNGQIANTVFQISAKPIKIATSINKENLTHDYIENSKLFSVSILSTKTPFKFIGLFGFRSGRDVEKFKEVDYIVGESGVPIVVENSLGYIEAKVVGSVDVGTHTLFIGEVINAEKLEEGEPMSYAYYHNVVKGKTPEKAATYLEVKK
jgi:ferric-chelate reductase [NAD(P)H]